MTAPAAFDPLILGRRIRHYRRARDLTLDQLGVLVGKPAPYLSLLENGKKEPRLGLINDLAVALEVGAGDLAQDDARLLARFTNRVTNFRLDGAGNLSLADPVHPVVVLGRHRDDRQGGEARLSTPAIVAAIRNAIGRDLTRVPVKPEDIIGVS